MGEQNEERDRESEKDRYFLAACNVMAYALFCFRLPIFNIILFVCFFFVRFPQTRSKHMHQPPKKY